MPNVVAGMDIGVEKSNKDVPSGAGRGVETGLLTGISGDVSS